MATRLWVVAVAAAETLLAPSTAVTVAVTVALLGRPDSGNDALWVVDEETSVDPCKVPQLQVTL
jgi:hypothetical protein